MSIKDELAALVQLQVRQLQLERVQERLEALPEERRALRERVQTAQQRVSDGESGLEAEHKERRLREGELQDAEVQVSKYKDQIHEVKTNEQLWALQAEIAQAEEKVGELEEAILVSLERADELEETIAERRRELAQVEESVRAAEAELEERQRQLESRRDELQAAEEQLRQCVSDELLATYARIRKARGGRAVAEARAEMCAACNVRLRPQLFVEVRNAENAVTCDNCGRILFSTETLDLPPNADLHVLAEASG